MHSELLKELSELNRKIAISVVRKKGKTVPDPISLEIDEKLSTAEMVDFIISSLPTEHQKIPSPLKTESEKPDISTERPGNTQDTETNTAPTKVSPSKPSDHQSPMPMEPDLPASMEPVLPKPIGADPPKPKRTAFPLPMEPQKQSTPKSEVLSLPPSTIDAPVPEEQKVNTEQEPSNDAGLGGKAQKGQDNETPHRKTNNRRLISLITILIVLSALFAYLHQSEIIILTNEWIPNISQFLSQLWSDIFM